MNNLLVADRCVAISAACVLSAHGRSIYNEIAKAYPNNRLNRLCYNIWQGIALSIFCSNQIVSQYDRSLHVFLLPSTILLAMSGLSYIARCTNYRVNKLEIFDENIGYYMDLTIRVLSIASLILLVFNVKKYPMEFSFACVSVTFNLIAGRLSFLYRNNMTFANKKGLNLNNCL